MTIQHMYFIPCKHVDKSKKPSLLHVTVIYSKHSLLRNQACAVKSFCTACVSKENFSTERTFFKRRWHLNPDLSHFLFSTNIFLYV